jgi:hypothetical protein
MFIFGRLDLLAVCIMLCKGRAFFGCGCITLINQFNEMSFIEKKTMLVAITDGPTATRDRKLYMASHAYHARSDYLKL